MIAGELDMASVGRFMKAAQVVHERDDHEVEVDARELTFCDSVGLRALLGMPGPRPIALRPSDSLLQVLEATRLVEQFKILA